MATKPVVPEQPTGDEVFTKYITLKNGRRIYAASYGLKVFCFKPTTKKKSKPQ
jgi:hypothetical protein